MSVPLILCPNAAVLPFWSATRRERKRTVYVSNDPVSWGPSVARTPSSAQRHLSRLLFILFFFEYFSLLPILLRFSSFNLSTTIFIFYFFGFPGRKYETAPHNGLL